MDIINKYTMAVQSTLTDFEQFDLNSEPTSLGIQWKRWSSRLENLFVALNIKNEGRQKALLMHYGGKEFMILCETLLDENDTYEEAREKLNNYFEPQINLAFETYRFRSMVQEDGETVDQFCTRLKTAASRCDFSDENRELRDQIVMSCTSNTLRKKALRDDLKLPDLLACARSHENADRQAALIEGSSEVRRIGQQDRKTLYKSSKKTTMYVILKTPKI